jgi:integrase
MEYRQLRRSCRLASFHDAALERLLFWSGQLWLRKLCLVTEGGRLPFLGARSVSRKMSDSAANASLARIGYKGSITGHGFRHKGSTLLGELGWSPEALERQLSHKEPGVSGVYNKAQHLPERRNMMQEWADYLDMLKAGGSHQL